MAKKYCVAVAGATGVVGGEMLATLTQRKFPFSDVRLLASSDSRGELIDVLGEPVEVQELTGASFDGVDIALFATSAALSEQFVPAAIEAGAIAIDNSSFFRMKPEIPLVVPEVNADQLKPDTRIIANPNCSTIQLVPVLDCLQKAAGLERVVVATYQSVSGAGRDALDELFNQTRAIFNQTSITPEAFAHQIAFNCIPQIDLFMDDGYTKEEYKIINESRKILGLPELRITTTAVRVPVFYSHAEAVNVELKRPLSVEEFRKALAQVAGVQVYDDHTTYPMQLDAAGQDDILVGRIRKDQSVKNGFDFWIVADNVRKGAALNAVQIAEEMINRGLI